MLVGIGLTAREVDRDDVERRARLEGGALLVVQDVVRRGDEVLKRARHLAAVVEGVEGLEIGHRGRRYQRRRTPNSLT